MSSTKEIRAHVEYLRSTLIPDLKESGREFTAQDFETCVEHIESLLLDRERLRVVEAEALLRQCQPYVEYDGDKELVRGIAAFLAADKKEKADGTGT